MFQQNKSGRLLSGGEMKQIKGAGGYGTLWRCLYTLSGKTGTISYECSASDPSGPNYYCTATKESCVLG